MERTTDEERQEELERQMEGSMNLLSDRTVADSMHVEERSLRRNRRTMMTKSDVESLAD